MKRPATPTTAALALLAPSCVNGGKVIAHGAFVESARSLKRLLSLFGAGKTTPTQAQIPEGKRVYAIGDIHGRLDLLKKMLAELTSDEARRPRRETTFIFLGDLIDRGPSSAAVIERLIDFANERHARFICGNHEEILRQLLQGHTHVTRMFTRIGGRETALSYGLSERDYNDCDFDELPALLTQLVPQRHREFFSAMEDMIVIGGYAFVHAGIEPGLALAGQDMHKTRWIRDEFTKAPGPFEKVIVHGHSITADIDDQSHRIGLDTGAFRSGILSAMGFESTQRWAIRAFARDV